MPIDVSDFALAHRLPRAAGRLTYPCGVYIIQYPVGVLPRRDKLSGQEWVVLSAGIGLVAWINWYFLSPVRAVRLTIPAAGPQAVRIVVAGGYQPSSFVVSAARPVRLVFDRRETTGCSEEVVIPELGVRRFLPPFEETVIDLGRPAAGSYEFTCGMSMLRGRMIVE